MHSAVLAQVDNENQENPFWLTVGDLMSGLLLVFVLLLLVVLLNLAKQLESSKNTRANLFEQLARSLKKKNIHVEIDSKQGTITIREKILFDSGRYKLKEKGIAFLREFVPTFASVAFSREDFKREITRIVLEGHTDQEGSEQSNLFLSMRRSLAVMELLMEDDFEYEHTEHRKELINRLLPSGRGEIDANQERVVDADRRVIFRIQFRDVDFLAKSTEVIEGVKALPKK